MGSVVSDNDAQTISVAIVGGGVAGLSLAAGLIKLAHIKLQVFEAVPKYADVGAGLALHQNAIRAMASIGPEAVQAYLDKATTMGEPDDVIATQVILAQGPHAGQQVAELGKAKGRKTVSRADLLDGLRALLPDDSVMTGKRLHSCSDMGTSENGQVALLFEDGSQASADCVLGADGIHGAVRAHVLGKEHPAVKAQNHDGWQIYRRMVSTEEARKEINPKWTEKVPILLGPRGHINCIPLNRGTRVSAGVAVRGAASREDMPPPPLDPSLYADYSEEAQEIVRMVAKDTTESWVAGDYDDAPTYRNGRVAIFGDAAHASLPFAGNGAAQALEDSAVLYTLFGAVRRPEQVQSALDAYCKTRLERSQQVVRLSRQFGRV
ncbi:FAD/NAD(P)-binding domain-containing protein [Xylariaceae sp. FL0594]|nr:FAD/NAD(P)-binding domain-containing protein [Xylariaceae sp. FL0594]